MQVSYVIPRMLDVDAFLALLSSSMTFHESVDIVEVPGPEEGVSEPLVDGGCEITLTREPTRLD